MNIIPIIVYVVGTSLIGGLVWLAIEARKAHRVYMVKARLLENLSAMARQVNSGCPPTAGICSALPDYESEEDYKLARGTMHTLFKAWSKFSGRTSYPVPGVEETPASAYWDACAYGKLWDRATYYGRDRIELLHFMIDTMEDGQEQSIWSGV